MRVWKQYIDIYVSFSLLDGYQHGYPFNVLLSWAGSSRQERVREGVLVKTRSIQSFHSDPILRTITSRLRALPKRLCGSNPLTSRAMAYSILFRSAQIVPKLPYSFCLVSLFNQPRPGSIFYTHLDSSVASAWLI